MRHFTCTDKEKVYIKSVQTADQECVYIHYAKYIKLKKGITLFDVQFKLILYGVLKPKVLQVDLLKGIQKCKNY